MHDAQIVHLAARVNFARRDDALRQRARKAPPEERHGAHSWKGVEGDLGQPQAGVFLGDEEVGDERALKSAAQALPVNGRERDDRQAEVRGEAMHDVDANLGVRAQGPGAPLANRRGEGGEVSPETEDAGTARGDHEIADGPADALVALDQAQQRSPRRDDLHEHFEREVMRRGRLVLHPEGACLLLVANVEIVEAPVGKILRPARLEPRVFLRHALLGSRVARRAHSA